MAQIIELIEKKEEILQIENFQQETKKDFALVIATNNFFQLLDKIYQN